MREANSFQSNKAKQGLRFCTFAIAHSKFVHEKFLTANQKKKHGRNRDRVFVLCFVSQ